MTSLTDILLVGGTGTLGSAIRKALVANKSKFSRIGVLTSLASIEDPKKKPAFETIEKDEGLSIVVSNLDDVAALTKAMEGWDTVICALAPAGVPKQRALIDAAVNAGVTRFFPSEFGFDLSTPFNSIQQGYKGKIVIEDYIQQKCSENPDFSYTFVSNGSFAEFLFNVPPAVYELDQEKHTVNIVGHSDAEISFTSYADVGNFVVAILLHPEETKNRLICVQGQLSCWDEIIASLEKLQGVKYSVKYTSLQDAEELEERAWSEGTPLAFRLNLRRCMGTGNAKLENVDNEMFPEVKVTTNMEEIAKKALIKKGLLK